MDYNRIKNYRDENIIDCVLDTDAFNEIDDQFAICYMLQNRDRLNIKELYAAPFYNNNSLGPADGMIKSYDEIVKLLKFAGKEGQGIPVYKGSESFLKDERTPVLSDAARRLCDIASGYSPEKPLFVIAIGAITNVASALIQKPEIAGNIVIVWLGGTAYHVGSTHEFNMIQDIAAARVVFSSAAPVVMLPCEGCVTEFLTTEPELTSWLEGKNAVSDYLLTIVRECGARDTAWSRVIWDVTAVAWLLNENGKFMGDIIMPAKMPGYDGKYTDEPAKEICYVKKIYRDALFTDLFKKLQLFR